MRRCDPGKNLARFYCDNISDSLISLTGSEVHHLTHVLRLNVGDKVEVFDGRGKLVCAVIEKIDKSKVSLKTGSSEVFQKPVPRIIIATSIAKGDRFDWLIAKCTELGADRIVPVIFERTVKQSQNPKITGRWRNISIASAKQCRRIFLPQIDMPAPLEQVVNQLKTSYPNASLLLGSPDANCRSLIKATDRSNDKVAFIGPEGGLTDDEQTLLLDRGAESVRIGSTVLRIETAALAFTSILAAQRDTEKDGGQTS